MAEPYVHPEQPPTLILTGPPGVADLPCYRTAGGGVMSVWRLDANEIRAVLDGAPLEIWFSAPTHPPVMITVYGVEYGPGDEK